MTISSQVRTAGPYAGNGSTATFPFAFKVFQASDLEVALVDPDGTITPLVLSSDFAVTLNADQETGPGGSITLLAGVLGTGYSLSLTSDIDPLQLMALTNQGGFFPKVIERSFDRSTILIQQLYELNSRTLRVGFGDTVSSIPSATSRANRLLAFDSQGNPTTAVPADQSASSLALQLTSAGGAGQVGAPAPPGFPALVGNLDDKLRDYWTIQSFRDRGDSSPIWTKAAQRMHASGVAARVPLRGEGNYLIDEPAPIMNGGQFTYEGSFQPATNDVPAGTAMVPIKSSDVSITGRGGIDCISEAFNNWGGFVAGFTTERYRNIHLDKLSIRNLGLNSTATLALALDGCDDSSIKYPTLYRVGMISSTAGGGYGIYTSFCSGHSVVGAKGRFVGSTFMNETAGLGGIFSGNEAFYSTLFVFKGGYAPNISTVTADITPTDFVFSIDRTVSALRNLRSGNAFICFNETGLSPIIEPSAITDMGTYLQVNIFDAPMDIRPQVGAQIQLLMTGAQFMGQNAFMAGDNIYDIQGDCGFTIKGGYLKGAGMYVPAGATPYIGLGCAVWAGYDPQTKPGGGFYNQMGNAKRLVDGLVIDQCAGSGVALMSTTFSFAVVNCIIGEVNRRSNVDGQGFPSSGGVETHRLSFARSGQGVVSNNQIKSKNGFGIWSAYSRNDILEGNNVTVTDIALMITSQIGLRVNGGSYTTTLGAGQGAYGAILIRDPSGVNANSDIRIRNTQLTVAAGYPINNQDPNYDATLGNFPNDCTGGEFGTGINNHDATFIPAGMVSDSRLAEYKSTPFIADGASLLMSTQVPDQGGYKLHVQLFEFASTFAKAEYEISRGGASIDVWSARPLSGASVTSEGGKFIRITNTSGGNRQIVAWVAKA